MKDIIQGGTACAAALLAAGLGLSGCAVSLIADAASMGTWGKSLTDHLLDAVTGLDCRLTEGIVRADRAICEPPGSPATLHDFHGFGSGRG